MKARRTPEGDRVFVMQEATTSYCKKKIMSICTAESPQKQQECHYYEQSCHAAKCMYFVFEEYCDCLAAQINQ